MSERDGVAKVNVSALTQRHRDTEEVGRGKISVIPKTSVKKEQETREHVMQWHAIHAALSMLQLIK